MLNSPLQTCLNPIKEINDILFNLFRVKKGDKIKRTVMINDYDDDGAKMLDTSSFNQALKLTWIIKYSDHTNKGKSKNLFNHWLDKLGRKKRFYAI